MSPTRPRDIGTCTVCAEVLPVQDGRSLRRRTCSAACRNAARRARYNPKGRKPLTPLAERLWSRCLRAEGGCLEWQGYRRPSGYGQIGRGARADGLIETHRAAWELTRGPIPNGMFVCHHCDNPPCCEPDHLFLGTVADNVADMVAKGRQATEFRLPHTRLSDRQIRELRELRDSGWIQRELAEHFGITQGYVSQILAGQYRRSA